MMWMVWTALVLVVVTAAALSWGHLRWNRLTAALFERLDAARVPLHPTRVDLREIDGLPAPVQRYFRAALQDGAPMVVGAAVEHRGSFNMSTDIGAPQWRPFTSRQRVVTRRPGFVWDGRVAMLPGLAVNVHDAYVGGEGILHPAVAGLVTLGDLRGTEDVAVGELMRFFAEAAWYPTALLPSQGVQWQAVDERSARATLHDGTRAVTLQFFFGKDGLVTAVRAETRGRTVGDAVIPTPWEGRWSNHQRRDGMRVPLDGEVAWLLPEGPLIYWRGTITALRYEFTR
jgi:hypothetical protein